MKNRYEFHARKSDATIVYNEHHLRPKSGENVGVLNMSVRFRCQNRTQTFVIFRNFAILFLLGCFGMSLDSVWHPFGSMLVAFGSLLVHFGTLWGRFSFALWSCGASGFAPLFYPFMIFWMVCLMLRVPESLPKVFSDPVLHGVFREVPWLGLAPFRLYIY